MASKFKQNNRAKSRGSRRRQRASPIGREATVAALVETATRLFAASGPDGVALRTIADEAGVNYGLIHQYVGSKDELLRLVMRAVSEQAASDFESAEDLNAAVDRLFDEDVPTYVPMLAWALLQDRDGSNLLGRSPALEALADRMTDGDSDERAARLVAVTAMALGWQLFGRFVAAGVGRTDPGELTPQLKALAGSLLSTPTGGTERPLSELKTA